MFDYNYWLVDFKWFFERIYDILIRGKVRIRNSYGIVI